MGAKTKGHRTVEPQPTAPTEMPDEPSTSAVRTGGSSPTEGSPTVRSEACRKHANEATERRLLARIEREHEDEEEEEHEHTDNHSSNTKKVAFMIAITFLFFIVELTVGLVNASIALLADSYHMLSDVMALSVALICLRIARRQSKRNGFGWVRAEVLGALSNGVFLLSMGFTISLESFGRIIHPRKMMNPIQVLIVGIIGLLINGVGIGILHGDHGHSHGGGGHGHSHGGGGKKKTKNGGHGHSHADGTHHDEEHAEETHSVHGDSVHDTPEAQGEDIELDELAPRTRPGRSISRLSNDCSHNLSRLVGSGSKQHLALKLVALDDTSVTEEYEDEEEGKRKIAKKAQDAKNLNMRGVILHLVSDAIGSVFVVLTAIIQLVTPARFDPYTIYLDPCLSLILVSLISFTAFNLVQEAAAVLLRKAPVFFDADDMTKDILKISGVAAVKEIICWTLVANRHISTLHVEFCSPAAFDQAAPKIRRIFHGIGIHSLTIQPSFSPSTCVILTPVAEEIEIEEEKINNSINNKIEAHVHNDCNGHNHHHHEHDSATAPLLSADGKDN